MKFTIERTVLLRSLNHVQSIVERRNTIPILANVQLHVHDGRLDMTATDLDIAVRETTEANVSQPGKTTAPAHTLHDIVRKLPEGAQVEFTLGPATGPGAGRINLVSGRSKFQLACLPADDFPVMAEKESDWPVQFVIAAGDLKRLIDKTRFAISTEETRYYLNGIYLHAAQTGGVSMLRAVATDGHRLARVELPLPAGAGKMPGIILPRKTVLELRKLLDETTADVSIALSESKIRFAFDSVMLTSKLIDGTFPDYSRVIPTENDKRLGVDSRALALAVDRVSTISSEKSRAVKVNLSKELITLTVNSPDHGNATEEIPATYAASPIEIGFNAKYLLDIVAQIDGDIAVFEFFDAHSPTLIRDSDDDNSLYVLMPMRV